MLCISIEGILEAVSRENMKIEQPAKGEQDLHFYAGVGSPLRGKKCVQKSKSIEKVVTLRQIPCGHGRCLVGSGFGRGMDTA